MRSRILRLRLLIYHLPGMSTWTFLYGNHKCGAGHRLRMAQPVPRHGVKRTPYIHPGLR